MLIKPSNYFLPLVTGKKLDNNTFDSIRRYAGVAFYIGANGLISTCAHILESLSEAETLIAKDLNLDQFLEVHDLISHPTFDFAVGRINVHNNHFLNPTKRKIYMGTSVSTYGYANYGKEDVNLILDYRFIRGYITVLGDRPDPVKRTRSHCELNFPVYAGFSGAPLLLDDSQDAGMLLGNYQSSIEESSFQEIQDNNNTYTEKIYNTVEFGIAHTADDILAFLDELNIRANE